MIGRGVSVLVAAGLNATVVAVVVVAVASESSFLLYLQISCAFKSLSSSSSIKLSSKRRFASCKAILSFSRNAVSGDDAFAVVVVVVLIPFGVDVAVVAAAAAGVAAGETSMTILYKERTRCGFGAEDVEWVG